MAHLTILTPDQLAERDQKPTGQGRSGRRRSAERTRIIDAYKAELQDAQPGYGADVLLAEGEDKRQVRQNMQAAAAELNLALAFRPIKDKARMHVRFITLEERAAQPKRGGRPRKAVQTETESTREPVQEEPAAAPKKRTRRPRVPAREVGS